MLKILCRGKTVGCEEYGCRAYSSSCQHALMGSHRYFAARVLAMQCMHDLQADGVEPAR